MLPWSTTLLGDGQAWLAENEALTDLEPWRLPAVVPAGGCDTNGPIELTI